LPKENTQHPPHMPHIFFVFFCGGEWRESERERRRHHRLAHVNKNNGIFQQQQL